MSQPSPGEGASVPTLLASWVSTDSSGRWGPASPLEGMQARRSGRWGAWGLVSLAGVNCADAATSAALVLVLLNAFALFPSPALSAANTYY